ncbi:hypothetical protein, partial [Burkholderia vietnamiensis]|uniref:hypothetical protein n=1 Tax=Burkholderia vietnamiensis TaxID=60552 RepID=UPI001E408326
LASDSRRRVDNALFNRLAHKNADRFVDAAPLARLRMACPVANRVRRRGGRLPQRISGCAR